MSDVLRIYSRLESVETALKSLGGQARPAEIAEQIRKLSPGPHPTNLLQSIRARIQECSSDSGNWKRKRDLFYSVYGIGGGVWGLRDMDPLNPANQEGMADPVELFMAAEGTARLRTHLRRERSKPIIDRFKKQLKSFACTACGFDFEEIYGELGRGFIEAHHKIPVAELKPGAMTVLSDLVAVCSNCHRMLHRSEGVSIDELRNRLSGKP